MSVSMGEYGQDTGLKYKNGSPVHIGDLAAFDADVWNRNLKNPGSLSHLFVVGYENGEVTGAGALSESSERWSLVDKHDDLPVTGNCRATTYNRELVKMGVEKLRMPPERFLGGTHVWRIMNPEFFANLSGDARWMVIDRNVDSTTLEKDTPLLIDLS